MWSPRSVRRTSDGYSAVQLGFGAIKAKKVTKPDAGHFDKADVTPRKHLVEIRTADASEYTLGQELTADVFNADEIVDVDRHQQGQGQRRRDEAARLRGLRASHGVHRKHRSPGSIGGCATPAGSSRACGWPAGWATSASLSRTSPSTRSTPSAG